MNHTLLHIRPGEYHTGSFTFSLTNRQCLSAELIVTDNGESYRVHHHFRDLEGNVFNLSQGRLHFSSTGRPYFRKNGRRYYLEDFDRLF